MCFGPGFYRIAAICSAISVLSTLALIHLPSFYEPNAGFEGRMARVHDPVYQLRAWIYFLHPFLVLAAAIALAVRIRAKHAGLALMGGISFLLWSFTEAVQQTMTLFAFDVWRSAWPVADAAARTRLEIQVAVYDGLWNGMYFLLIVGFAMGNLLLGIALAQHRGFTRMLGFVLLVVCALTVRTIVVEVEGPDLLPGALGRQAYPVVQPIARLLLFIWLWRMADESRALS